MATNPDCPCPKLRCRHNADCASCRGAHYAKGSVPYCERPPKPDSRVRRVLSRVKDHGAN